jgi:hypothetical protein
MADLREWFWQLEASGLGPDHFFAVRFSCQRFTDQRTFDALKSMQESGIQSNIYVTSSIEICDANLSIENTYARHEDGETAFLVAVFQFESLTVQEWRVFAGGSDYDSIEVARGDSAASFLEYLQN